MLCAIDLRAGWCDSTVRRYKRVKRLTFCYRNYRQIFKLCFRRARLVQTALLFIMGVILTCNSMFMFMAAKQLIFIIV